jgi:STE24 endopeptidase
VSSPKSTGQAKAYNRLKLVIGIVSSALTFLVLGILVVSGYSRTLAEWAMMSTSYTYVALLLFTAVIASIEFAVTLPLSFYSGYVVEHRFNLSNQSLGRWAWEHTKGVLVSAPIAVAIVVMLYLCLDHFGELWWLVLGAVLTVFSVLLARLAPVLLLPLFYKFVPLEDGSLKRRIVNLCRCAALRFEGVYTFDMSKNTKKANAGLTGIGKAKRIILGDTLVREFTEEEIETVFAHELGHYVHRHILISIFVGTVSTFAGLSVAARLYRWSLPAAGFGNLTDLGALPVLALWLSLFALVTTPLGNMLSRRHERQADVYAVETTHNAPAFASALRKLASQNLADPEPHPLVEFLFYSHPSIVHRLRRIEQLEQV